MTSLSLLREDLVAAGIKNYSTWTAMPTIETRVARIYEIFKRHPVLGDEECAACLSLVRDPECCDSHVIIVQLFEQATAFMRSHGANFLLQGIKERGIDCQAVVCLHDRLRTLEVDLSSVEMQAYLTVALPWTTKVGRPDESLFAGLDLEPLQKAARYYSYPLLNEMDEVSPIEPSKVAIHAVWFNKNKPVDFLCDRGEDYFKKQFGMLFKEWGERCPEVQLNLWYDGAEIDEDVFDRSRKCLSEIVPSLQLRDIRELVKGEFSELFERARNFTYARVDLAKAAISVWGSSAPCSIVVDLDVLPMSLREIFCKQTWRNFSKCGFLMGKSPSGGQYPENGFTILNRDEEEAFGAYQAAFTEYISKSPVDCFEKRIDDVFSRFYPLVNDKLEAVRLRRCIKTVPMDPTGGSYF